jgi:hypothetical protein
VARLRNELRNILKTDALRNSGSKRVSPNQFVVEPGPSSSYPEAYRTTGLRGFPNHVCGRSELQV